MDRSKQRNIRLRCDLEELKKEYPLMRIIDEHYHVEVPIDGPSETPYDGGVFWISYRWPMDYPYSPPKVNFKTKIYHPNVSATGGIDHDMLRATRWSPALRPSMVLKEILDLMASPNFDNPLSLHVADIYQSDKAKFEETARRWTEEYAME